MAATSIEHSINLCQDSISITAYHMALATSTTALALRIWSIMLFLPICMTSAKGNIHVTFPDENDAKESMFDQAACIGMVDASPLHNAELKSGVAADENADTQALPLISCSNLGILPDISSRRLTE
jgi:hypothetical protein